MPQGALTTTWVGHAGSDIRTADFSYTSDGMTFTLIGYGTSEPVITVP
jgi:hypothetical protein